MPGRSTINQAEFRFYAELNDFLPASRRGKWIRYHFQQAPGIKDPIEALGVPHPEVELIVVNGLSVGFDYQLRHGDRVAVYPRFFQLDLSSFVPLRRPLGEARFVLDVHLGKLAKLLRLLGIDGLYRNDYSDAQIADIAEQQDRVVLSRDRRLLFQRRISHGRFIRNTEPVQQAREVISNFDLAAKTKPFSRCTRCNGPVSEVDKHQVLDRLEANTARYYEHFYQCADCGQVYWQGPHFQALADLVNRLREQS